MAPKIWRVLEGLVGGEGPHWDILTQSLYFVDMLARELHKYVPATGKHSKTALPDKNVSFIIPVEGYDDKFVITQNREICIATWNGDNPSVENIEPIVEVDTAPNTLANNLNDGKCDSFGRLWAGTISEVDMKTLKIKAETGSIYSLGSNNLLKQHVKHIGLSNGIAFNSVANKIYYIDSHKNTVNQYDFDITSGKISNPKVIFTFSKHDPSDVLLDGMTIDTDGYLWIAVPNGSMVIKIDPRTPDKIVETIKLPAKQPTSLIFGGPNLDELYVTSACFNVNDEVLLPPDNGALYKITGTGAKGLPGFRFRL